MLVLSRRKGESIIIDGKIEIDILEVEGGNVRIGITAPLEMDILRKELILEVEDENKGAVSKLKEVGDLKDLFTSFKKDK